MIESFTLTSSSDGLTLSGLRVEPDSMPCQGVILCVHGMCEHKERYIPLMTFLASHGYASFLIDHRGHGASVRTADDLGFMYRVGWLGLVQDQHDLYQYARSLYPNLPVTMIGHSMGSLVARAYTKRFDDTLTTLILTGSPSDNPAKAVGKMLAAIIGRTRGWHTRPQMLQRMSFGSYNKPFAHEGYANAWVCSDHDVLESYHHDPLCQYVFTANGFYHLLGLMQDVYTLHGWSIHNPSLPIHFLSGAQDPCRISDQQFMHAVDLMKRVGYTHVRSFLYPQMRHEILNETNRQQVWADILAIL